MSKYSLEREQGRDPNHRWSLEAGVLGLNMDYPYKLDMCLKYAMILSTTMDGKYAYFVKWDIPKKKC